MDIESGPPSGERRHVPEELVEEILLLLPVKSLLRFRSVFKPWKSLIDSKKFIYKQLKSSTKNEDIPNHRVIFVQQQLNPRPRHVPKQINLMLLLNDPSKTPSPTAPDPINTNDSRPKSIVGCCNGLVCIVDDFIWSVFLWNPATRISKKLPSLILDNGRNVNILGFGWDESSGAYKVLAFVYCDWSKCYTVYSSKTNSWKKLEQLPDQLQGISSSDFNWKRSTFACGKLHWFKKDGDSIIVSFDLKSEEFGVIETGLFNYFWLGEIGGCVAVVCHDLTKESSLDVWVMKEESWLKLANIPCVYQHSPIFCPLVTIIEEAPVNEKFSRLYREPRDGVFSRLRRGDFNVHYYDNKYFVSSHRANVYVESLVSPLEMD